MSNGYDPRKHLEELETAKKAVRCPHVQEARTDLFLSVKQFCELLEISEVDYWDMVGGGKQLSTNQKLFLVEALRIAKERGLIPDRRF